MWEIRQRVKGFIRESAYSTTSLSAEITNRYGYKVWSSEMSRYLSSKLDTPKARKALTDALEILTQETRHREKLLNQK